MYTFNIGWRRGVIAVISTIVISSLPPAALADGSNSKSSAGNTLSGLWPAVNIDASNLNVSKDTVLTSSNISSIVNIDPGNTKGMLKVDPTGHGATAVDSTPVIDANGNVYVATGGGSVIAYSSSGDQLWKRDLKDESGNAEFFDESPLLAGTAVFIAGRMMHKLDITNGSDLAAPLVFNSKVAPFLPPFIPGVSTCPYAAIQASQLMLAGDKVIYAISFSNETTCGTSLYPYVHGQLIAFNAFDKKGLSIAWNIDLTTIGPDGKPVLDSHGNPVSYGAGVSSFAGGAVDPKRHLFFIGTGNQYADPNNPNSGVPGSPGNKISPISDALIAVNYDTGKIVWFYQYQANDIWGGGDPQFQLSDGKHDLDVHCHPQIFSVDGLDFVGCRGKDGTYRLFFRDQIPGHIAPVAQILLDPATASDGSLQVDPAIVGKTMYIASTAWVENAADTFDPNLFPGATSYTPVTGRRTSIDILDAAAGGSRFAGALYATTTFRAIDLEKLIVYGASQLLKGNKTPVCVGSPNSTFNPGTTITGAPTCVGQLPADIIKWTQAVRPLYLLGSSGMTYDNGVLIVGGIEGVLTLIDTTNNGAVISSPTVNPIVPVPLSGDPALPPFLVGFLNAFGLQGVPILGGVSTVNGQLYVPTGLSFPGDASPLAAYGGLVIYKKP